MESLTVTEIKSFHIFEPKNEIPKNILIKINVLDQNRDCFTFYINPSESVKNLKRLIEMHLGINIKHQGVLFKYKVMKDDLILNAYQMKENDIVRIMLINIPSLHPTIEFMKGVDQIKVRLLLGKEFIINFNYKQPVIELKKLLFYKIGLEVEKQVLYSHGKILKDQFSLLVYSFYARDLILMQKSHVLNNIDY